MAPIFQRFSTPNLYPISLKTLSANLVIFLFPILLLKDINGRHCPKLKPIGSRIFFSDLQMFTDSSNVLEDQQCTEVLISNDTLKQNSPYTFEQALLTLKNRFKSIDSLTISLPAKKYAKALNCADFIYTTFSYRLFGDSLGINNDSILSPEWASRTLANCYAIGNNNYKAVYCGDRTNFYCRLVDSLLHIKTTVIQIQGIHTFPLSIIYGKAYIIDPYCPFVTVDTSLGIVLDYNSIINTNTNSIKIFPSARSFGTSRELISIPFLKKISHNCNPIPIALYTKKGVSRFLASNKELTLNDIRLPDFTKTRPIAQNHRFAFAVSLNKRPDGPLRNKKDLFHFYFKQNE